LDRFHEQALSRVTSPKVREAFDLEHEPRQTIARYGSQEQWFQYHRSEVYWDFELFVRGRRLVEAGVPVVSLQAGVWDHHCGPELGSIFEGYRSLLPLYDQSLSALLADLHERGLSEQVAVVVWGEFEAHRMRSATVHTDGAHSTAVPMRTKKKPRFKEGRSYRIASDSASCRKRLVSRQ